MRLEWLITGFVAALLTFFDIGRTFYIPSSGTHKRVFFSWASGFVATNAGLAIILYFSLRDTGPLQSLNKVLGALIIGASYLVLVRSKLATIRVQAEEIPLGLEYVYNGAKEFVYGRMNSASIAALTDEAARLATDRSLKDLASQATAYIRNNNLLSADQKASRKAWLVTVLKDTTGDEEKRITLATYILSERM
jgi:hypothetical protein